MDDSEDKVDLKDLCRGDLSDDDLSVKDYQAIAK